MKRADYIWISRWEDFQHYRPERDRPPAWIKDYTKQMTDARYLRLSDRQRALLVDLRRIHATTSLRTPCDHTVIGRHRQMRTFKSDLDALRQAGFIEYVSRRTLEQRLDQLYSSPRARVEGEGEKEKDLPRADAREDSRKRGKAKPSSYDRAAAFTRNAGYQLEPVDFLAELDGFDLTAEQRHEVITLRESLNGRVLA